MPEQPISKAKKSRFLKDLDGFGVPVKWYVHRNNSDMKGSEPVDSYGSKCGGVVSMMYYFFLIFYLVTLIYAMFIGANDNIKTQSMNNPFDKDLKGINLFEENFMPFLEVSKINEIHPTSSFDVFGADN
jgi:hypothetical protein